VDYDEANDGMEYGESVSTLPIAKPPPPQIPEFALEQEQQVDDNGERPFGSANESRAPLDGTDASFAKPISAARRVTRRQATPIRIPADLRTVDEIKSDVPVAVGTIDTSDPSFSAHMIGVSALVIPVCSFAGYRWAGLYGAAAGTIAGGSAINLFRGYVSTGPERKIALTYGVLGVALTAYLSHLAIKNRSK
jgi:hypothetical protein